MHSSPAILVPTDFTPPSAAALFTAAKMAKAMGLRLILLHVIHEAPEAPGYYRGHSTPTDDRPFDAIAKDLMATFIEHCQNDHPVIAEVPLEQAFLEGRPSQRIVDFALLKKVEMIVMGTHNLKGPKGWFIASKTKKVMRKVPMPITIVKTAYEVTAP